MQTAVSPGRAALFAALLAVVVYLPATQNRFALDDVQIVQRNVAAHSVGAALGAFADPYWPPEHGVGQWRPVVIGSFGLDWQLSGGSTTWLHATNILLHALVTALVVLFLARYATVIGALAGGLLFAVHPVHVEAVANLVGRAELLAAAGLLGALLFAHAVRRRRAAQAATWLQETGLLACIAFALLSKEHAVIAIALLWLDERAADANGARLPIRDYALTAALTATWLIARHFVDRGASFGNVAPTFIQLGAVGRISTMLTVVFVVLRLMVWPWDLSYDYRPQVIERIGHPTLLGAFGLVVLAALLALAWLAWRRNRGVALGLLVFLVAWLPTSNFLFPTGIVLSERTLYLSSVGAALLAACGADVLARRGGTRAALMAAAVIALPFAARTWTRESVWQSTRRLVLSAMATQPQSYAVRESLAHALWLRGQRQDALREYETAAELFPLDPYLQTRLAILDLVAGRNRDALRHLKAAQLTDPQSLHILADVYDSLGAPDSARAVRSRIPPPPPPLSRQQ